MAQHIWRRIRHDNDTVACASGVSTLYIMNLHSEYSKALEWIRLANTVSITNFICLIIHQHSNILIFVQTYEQSKDTPSSWSSYMVGGLLSAYSLTDDDAFKAKAEDAANYDVGFDPRIAQVLGGFLLETNYLHNYNAASNTSTYSYASNQIRRILRTNRMNLNFANDEFNQKSQTWTQFGKIPKFGYATGDP